ncbi:MAG: polysaccharide ABC transporter ATP-binding protein [Gemmatimonadota bacterium]|nr:polysaccharide ABC transporter ATP-binding protein [Gemmatimonadota bacterium]
MTRYAVRAYGLEKTFRIRHPHASTWRDYMRRPAAAFRAPRTLEVRALRGVSFEVAEGEVFGIVGRNGAGKSTLLKILARITSPSGGRATIAGRVASLLEVGTGFHPELTGRENVYLNGMLLGMPRREVDGAFEEICEFAGVGAYIDTPIKRYSSGMQLRLAFAVAAHLAADTMIIDEVLAVGDAEFQAKCTSAMKDAADRGRTTLFVSHNMAAVENLCTRAMLLRDGVAVATGSASEVVREYLRGALPEAGSGAMYFAAPSHHARGAARIERAWICGADGESPVQGEDLDVVVEIRAFDHVRKLQVVASIATIEGSLVSLMSNGDYRREWDVVPALHRVRLRVRDVRLVPRAYSLSLRLMLEWGADVLDDVPDALTFNVLGRDVLGSGVPLLANRGVTWAPAEWTLEPVVDAANQ